MSIFVQSVGVASAISLHDLETESRVNGDLSSGSSHCDSKSASTANLKMAEKISGGQRLIGESLFSCLHSAVQWLVVTPIKLLTGYGASQPLSTNMVDSSDPDTSESIEVATERPVSKFEKAYVY